jgi:hypothetical protein
MDDANHRVRNLPITFTPELDMVFSADPIRIEALPRM